MIKNGLSLLKAAPLAAMAANKHRHKGTSWGLSEAGYDIRIAQTVVFTPPDPMRFWELSQETDVCEAAVDAYRDEMKRAFHGYTQRTAGDGEMYTRYGRMVLASTKEYFQMPKNLVGGVADKSTWARKGVSVFNTVVEPGWHGYLTLELVFNGTEKVVIEYGCGIAQVLFGSLSDEGDYGDGKYQNAGNFPQTALS